MKTRLWYGFFFLFSVYNVLGQSIYRMNNVPIYHGAKALKNPFTGGMHPSIVNQMDLNNDGKKDLVIVQQSDSKLNRIQTFLQKANGEYAYTPRYEAFFPKELNAVFLLRDLNEDHLEDVIFKTNAYFLVYYTKRLNDTTFQLTFYDTLEYTSYDPLYGTQIITPLNYYLPILRDLDGDGDVDMLYLKAGALSKDERYFFKNYRKELGLTANELAFKSDNKYWGQFSFNFYPLSFIDGRYGRIERGIASPTNPNPPLKPRHDEYQMVWDLDINNDSLIDVVGYSENQSNAPLGVNIGTKDSAYILGYDTYFPSYDKPIKNIMPIGYWNDVDNDGAKDILSSFLIERDYNGTTLEQKLYNDDIQTLSFYKNLGKKKVPTAGKFHDSFQLINQNFLSEETVDVGTGSAPVFFDYDLDSLVDLFIPSYLKRDSWEVSAISYYKNVGTKKQPQYRLENSDFLNYKAKSRLNIRIAAGDLNNDGKEDLLITSFDKMTWAKFTSRPSSPLTVTNYEVYYQGGSKNAPFLLRDTLKIDYLNKFGISNICIYDIDKDGKKDLLIGDLYSLKYYRNRGTLTVPLFDTVICDSVIAPSSIYDVSIQEFRFFPAIMKDPKDQKEYLLFAYNFEGGKIGKALLDTQRLNRGIPLQVLPSQLNLFNITINIQPSISIKDITDDGIPEILFGNYAGGLQLFSLDSLTGEKDPPPPPLAINYANMQERISVYPVPFQDNLHIDVDEGYHKAVITIFSLDGRIVYSKEINQRNQLELSEIKEGNYILDIYSEKTGHYTLRLMKQGQ